MTRNQKKGDTKAPREGEGRFTINAQISLKGENLTKRRCDGGKRLCTRQGELTGELICQKRCFLVEGFREKMRRKA